MSQARSGSLLNLLPNTYRAFYGAFASLHQIQIQAIEPVLSGSDLIIQSRTGSGKTEAVLAPCIEQVIQSKCEKAILYIVPTKALAIDLERRLKPVLQDRLGLNLSIRTGDVKRKGGHRPDMLLTTPESLDVALGSANPDVREFIKRLRIIIIDEVHPFLETYRGRQLACLLIRLQLRTGSVLQKVAISATIADPDKIIKFFDFSSNTVKLITSANREIIPYLVHIKDDETEFTALVNDLSAKWNYRKILIFTNSRACCDRLFNLLNQQGHFKNICELHYSNLKFKERKNVEKRFRIQERSLCIATSTLELGIDIGDVDAVVLYEPPDSVSAFLQRIGRANRRQKNINFWGICRGENTGGQLLRFLGLINLSRQGIIESSLPKELYSVLIQQILSCLYEKKQISLLALQNLYPRYNEVLKDIFREMSEQSWLKEKNNQLFQGGWRYRDYLLEYKIWSNFPESEQNYILELSGESIADLPASLVKNLEIGDRVQIAGKRIKVVEITTGEQKYLRALPSVILDDKDLIWLGSGFKISYEVAQAIKDILVSPKQIMNNDTFNLFSRTKQLFEYELTCYERVVKLANGMELTRKTNGYYQYRTYLGSIGNLILQRTIEYELCPKHKLSEENELSDEDEGFAVEFDEIGVTCSHLIDFQLLDLPLDKQAFSAWIEIHKKALLALFSLNIYYQFLPIELKIQELTDFIFDPRLAEAFLVYLTKSGEIIEGDPSILEQQNLDFERNQPVCLQVNHQESLLNIEKQRVDFNNELNLLFNSHYKYTSFNITGSLISEYIRLKQCERFFCFSACKFPITRDNIDATQKIKIDQGKKYETEVMNHLKNKCNKLITIKALDDNGSKRSLQDRFEESIALINELITAVKKEPQKVFIVSQAVLIIREFIDNLKIKVDGIGIPDLLYVHVKNGQVVLEIGDIKGAHSVKYSHKWQVAFYAELLNNLIRLEVLSSDAKVSEIGLVIFSPPILKEDIFLQQKLVDYDQLSTTMAVSSFELNNYLLNFPDLILNFQNTLSRSPNQASFRVSGYCLSCFYYNYCYSEALKNEDIQFLPGITPGVLQKFRNLNLKTIEEVYHWFKSEGKIPRDEFSADQKDRLKQASHAVYLNQIIFPKQTTDLFPNNISNALFFYGIKDTLTGLPIALGLSIIDQNGLNIATTTWTISNLQDLVGKFESFFDQLEKVWNQSVKDNKVPYIFCFGKKSIEILEEFCDIKTFPFFRQFMDNYTDLQKIIKQFFYFPIPGCSNIFAIAYVLGLTSELEEPLSLLHDDKVPVIDINNQDNESIINQYINDILSLQTKIWIWISSHLVSNKIQCNQISEYQSENKLSYLEQIYRNFTEEEKMVKENDILTLQSYPLVERIARFRAIAPLSFITTILDEEGYFLYNFQLEGQQQFFKFREGDFLKLACIGMADLQEGLKVILVKYNRNTKQLLLRSRQRRLMLNKQIKYSLEEDLTDWNSASLIQVIKIFFSRDYDHPLRAFFINGSLTIQHDSNPQTAWVEEWLILNKKILGLNSAQQQALKLPFNHSISLIEGPPGTGKTYLLAWIIIALVQRAKDEGVNLRIVVSALTHQAIDNVLTKIVNLANQHQLTDLCCLKWGAFDNFDQTGKTIVKPLETIDELNGYSHVILGSTGFGLHRLFEGNKGIFPKYFDWVIFDEASQVLIPQALLSLMYGKSNFLFMGDTKQLPPIILGDYFNSSLSSIADISILAFFLKYQNLCIRLNETYRMNEQLCLFSSMMWYDSELFSAPSNSNSRLILADTNRHNDVIDEILISDNSLALLLIDHNYCQQKSEQEALVAAIIASRLMTCNGISPERLAILSPHRAQNNLIADNLSELFDGLPHPMPVIDTIERMQGAEREIIILSMIASDQDTIENDFLNNPNRFNVAITRASQKMIVIGSKKFFENVASSEEALDRNCHIKAFYKFCKERGCIYLYNSKVL